MTFNVGVNLTKSITVFVGYNFMYISQVARPGNQINPVIDSTTVPFSPNFGGLGNRPGHREPVPAGRLLAAGRELRHLDPVLTAPDRPPGRHAARPRVAQRTPRACSFPVDDGQREPFNNDTRSLCSTADADARTTRRFLPHDGQGAETRTARRLAPGGDRGTVPQGRLQDHVPAPQLLPRDRRPRDPLHAHPRAGDGPLRPRRLARLRADRLRLGRRERRDRGGDRTGRTGLQQGQPPAGAVGARGAERLARSRSRRTSRGSGSPPRW